MTSPDQERLSAEALDQLLEDIEAAEADHADDCAAGEESGERTDLWDPPEVAVPARRLRALLNAARAQAPTPEAGGGATYDEVAMQAALRFAADYCSPSDVPSTMRRAVFVGDVIRTYLASRPTPVEEGWSKDRGSVTCSPSAPVSPASQDTTRAASEGE